MKSVLLTLLAILTGAAVGAGFAVLVQRERAQSLPGAQAAPDTQAEIPLQSETASAAPSMDAEALATIEDLRRTVAALENRVRSLDDQLAAMNRDIVTATLRVDSLQEPIQAIRQVTPGPGERFVPFRPSGIIPMNQRPQESGLPFPESLAPPDDSLPLPRW